jgi:hypothetical protein
MILVDTNIIIDFWKNPTDKIKNIFRENDVFICGIVKAELLHGAKSQKVFNQIIASLSDFPEVPIYHEFWIDLGSNLNILKTNGITAPFQDVMLATLAIKFNLKIWTSDNHFKLMSKFLTELQLFNLS